MPSKRSNSLIKFCLLLLSSLLLSGCIMGPPPLPANAIRPVIAVTSFENRTSYEGQWALGSGMATLLLESIVESDHFTPVERAQLEDVVRELSLGERKEFRAEGKNIAALKNAKYLIRGVVTDFSQVSSGSFWVGLTSTLFGASGATARVALNLTIVEVASGQIIGSVSASGTASAVKAFIEADYTGVAFGGEAYFRTPLGEATSDAIKRAMNKLIRKMPRTYWAPMIASTNDQVVVLNGGHNHDVRAGDLFNVRESAKTVTDPQTGDTIARLPGAIIGKLEVYKVANKAAYAKILWGENLERGQSLEVSFDNDLDESSKSNQENLP